MNIKIKKLTKWVKVYIIQGFYGNGTGWEDEAADTSYLKAKQNLKEYQNNSTYPSRLITRRVLRSEYISGNF